MGNRKDFSSETKEKNKEKRKSKRKVVIISKRTEKPDKQTKTNLVMDSSIREYGPKSAYLNQPATFLKRKRDKKEKENL